MDTYDKEYRCTVHFGASTDTQDLEGSIIGGREPTEFEMAAMKDDNFAKIRALIERLPGAHMQLPPMYSALKFKGRPLYDYARSGVEIEREARPIHIRYAIFHSCQAKDSLTADFTVGCSKGTYIRTLCDSLGEQTGFGAYAEALRRTKCGPFSIEKAFTLEQLEQMKESGSLGEALLPERVALDHLPVILLSPEEARDLSMGKLLNLEIFASRMFAGGEIDPEMRYCAKIDETPVAIVYSGEKDMRPILRIERMLA